MRAIKLKNLMLSMVFIITGIIFLCAGWAFAATYSISGSVQFTDGDGASGVTVSAGGRSGTTGSSGSYSISGLENGTYTVSPSRSGFSFSPSSQRVTINNYNESGVSFSTPVFYIDGYVKYNTGDGVDGARVSCSAGSDYSGYNGYYKITGVHNGTSYSVSCDEPGTGSVNVNINGSNGSANFTAPTYSISGYVKYDNGVGVDNATVSVDLGKQASTNSSGYYTISGLPGGVWYRVTPSKLYTTITPEYASIYIGSSNGTANFTAKTGSIAGYVRYNGSGDGVSGVTITVGSYSTTTDGNGYYRKTGLLDGTYAVNASKSGLTFNPSGGYNVTITQASDGSGVDFTAIVYAISGYVKHGADGTPIQGATVDISGYGSVATDASGHYVKTNLPPGNYTVTASYPDYPFTPISVALSGADRSDIDFYTYVINGHVKQYGLNTGINGIIVTIKEGENTIGTLTTHDRDGNPADPGYYEKRVGGGTYTIHAAN